MPEEPKDTTLAFSGVGLTADDIYEAMKAVAGYIDITPDDFKELYCIAYRHASERFARSVLAKDIMTQPVVHVLPETPLIEVAEILSIHEISGLPVVDADHWVLGVVSEKDILSQLGFKGRVSLMTLVTQCLRANRNVELPRVEAVACEIMSSPAITVSVDTPLFEIAGFLSEKRINRLPVIDSDGCLVGILARSDIVNATLRSGTCYRNT